MVLVEIQNKSILLVEEDRNLALSVKLQLELNGYSVEMFADPVRALEQYVAAPMSYDLVITDIKMARMSTFEFMRSVKAENKDAKILLITPFEIRNEEFSRILPKSKVNGFVEKPFLHKQLVSSVRKILDPDYDPGLDREIGRAGRP